MIKKIPLYLLSLIAPTICAQDTISFYEPYVAEIKIDNTPYYHYFRFFNNGKCVALLSQSLSPDVWNLLTLQDKSLESGKYSIKGSTIKITTKKKPFSYSYKGKIKRDTLTLLKTIMEKKEIEKITYVKLSKIEQPPKHSYKNLDSALLVVKKETLDGCSFLLFDEKTNKYYEPINLPDKFKIPEKKVRVWFTPRKDLASICMKGEIVEILKIEEVP